MDFNSNISTASLGSPTKKKKLMVLQMFPSQKRNLFYKDTINSPVNFPV